jgi:NAD(P)-dependent dehydrogenase (short-subunit alcohol dehydrogenase family)
VRANSILPDWTLTPRTAPHLEAVAPGGVWPANPMGRPALPIDCAKAVLFLLSPAAGYLNGLSVPIDGGMRLRSAGWLAHAQPH